MLFFGMHVARASCPCHQKPHCMPGNRARVLGGAGEGKNVEKADSEGKMSNVRGVL